MVRRRLSVGRPPVMAWGGLDTSDRAPSSPVGLLDQRNPPLVEPWGPCDGARPFGGGSARVGPQRWRGVVSIRPTELLRRRSAYSTNETRRWSSRGVPATERDRSAAAQRGSAPSGGVGWSRYVRPSSFVAGRPTRPTKPAAGRAVGSLRRSETVRRRLSVGRPPAVAWGGLDTSDRAPSSPARPTRPTKPAAGRAVGSLRRSETVRRRLSAGRPPAMAWSGLDTSDRAPSSPVGLLDQRNPPLVERWGPCDGARWFGGGSAWVGPQRWRGVVSIRPTELLRRRSAYSTSETRRWSSRGVPATERDGSAAAQRGSAPSVGLGWSRYARSTLLRRRSAYSTNETRRWSSRGVLATERDRSAAVQRGSAPSDGVGWSRYARSTLLRRGSALLDQRSGGPLEQRSGGQSLPKRSRV
ncbi:hypothetical protein QE370_000731 [Aeromicrobium sp. SORGH_AS981]|nr:hypothetical protein [Aeromicrobium sp. SORGH_AS_0981]